ncbi:hypothetical protein [Sphingomonas sp. ID0503]|uniref:hypothetical protein n=1 Tax=Sphingomonas sp. ID0503 TaxID=3399691 RepID=UPI003AFA5FD3
MTSTLDDMLSRLRDEAGVTRISYFHCDHFEPWRWGNGRNGLDRGNTDDVLRFVEAMKAFPYARRLTLFMKSPLTASPQPRPGSRGLPGDEIYIPRLRRPQHRFLREALRAIVDGGHELQVHIHHERFTRNDWYSTSPERPENEPFRDFLTHRSTPEMDEARFELYLGLTLRLFRALSKQRLRRWMFVHGMWSLNGSDRDYCCIDREIEILQKFGCVGDFTFPAPRTHCNPAQEAPYLCNPVAAPKGYDDPLAAPEKAVGQKARRRFFIWSSQLSSALCSLDTVGGRFDELSNDPAGWAQGLIDGAVVRDGAVHVKTHAHSMMPIYFDGLPTPAYPHAHPAIQAMFGHLMDSAARTGLSFELDTAGSIYRRFVKFGPAAPIPPLPQMAEIAEA